MTFKQWFETHLWWADEEKAMAVWEAATLAERDACAKVRAGAPRELPPVGTGAFHREQQFCFEQGWKEGAAAVRKRIAARTSDAKARMMK